MTVIFNVENIELESKHKRRQSLRTMSKDDFINFFGSGSLRKANKLGINIQDSYLKERVKFEFGQGFDINFSSRILFGAVEYYSSQAFTEFCWHLERMIQMSPFNCDKFEPVTIEVTHSNGNISKGIGIHVTQTNCNWIPKGYDVYSIVIDDNNPLIALNPF